MPEKIQPSWQAMWDSMPLSQLRSHAGWVWHDYTHGTNIRHAPPKAEYAHALRQELLRRERIGQ